MRELLRSLPVFVGLPADLDVASLPSEPTPLFERWLREAIDEGVPEPHAMTLSTCDAGGVPDARILILKDVDEQGWWFATSRASAKGSQLDEPDLVCTSWQVYAVDAAVVEFWQGDKDRMHTRVQYTRDGREWSHHLLWP
jgi:pyridoxamine 5'-phosphate oxidase